MVNTACELYPEDLVDEIRRAYAKDLVNPSNVSLADVKRTLREGKEWTLEETRRHQKGLIGNVVDEMSWWACFGECDEEDHLDADTFEVEDDHWPPEGKTVVYLEPKIGRNDPCPCGSGKIYKKCCLDKDRRLH